VNIDLKATGWEGMDSIHLAKDRDTSGLLGNRVMNLCVPKMHKISQAAEVTLAFQKELCSMELACYIVSFLL
jgi:hypothetical protein